MATIKPFCGTHYNKEIISDLVSPPYDVISKDEKTRLKSTSPYNIVRLELPDETIKRDKYQQAGHLYNDWAKKSILQKDSKPAFYFYEQVFKSNGVKKRRRGFFAAVKLENPHKGEIKPHEKTLAKPKEDRLNLLRSIKANVSPIFGLFNDKSKKTNRIQ